jgi:hypothetical protein
MVGLVLALDHGEADFKRFEFTGGNPPGNPGAYRQGSDSNSKLYIHNPASSSNINISQMEKGVNS